MMLTKVTQVSQRSLTASWARYPIMSGDVPYGLFTDISITLPEYYDIYITSITVSDKAMTVLFVRYDDNKDIIVGTLTTTEAGVPVAAECVDGVSIVAVLGFIPDSDGVICGSGEVIQISPTCITAYSHLKNKPNTLSIEVVDNSSDKPVITAYPADGEPVQTDDMQIQVDDNISASIERVANSFDKTLVISLSDIGKLRFRRVSGIAELPEYFVTSINNIQPDDDGKLDITIFCGGNSSTNGALLDTKGYANGDTATYSLDIDRNTVDEADIWNTQLDTFKADDIVAKQLAADLKGISIYNPLMSYVNITEEMLTIDTIDPIEPPPPVDLLIDCDYDYDAAVCPDEVVEVDDYDNQ